MLRKVLPVSLLVLVLTGGIALAQGPWTVTLQWDPSSETDLQGYRVYQATASGMYDLSAPLVQVPATQTQYIITDLGDGDYYWVVTAYDNSLNESGVSNEAELHLDSIPPEPPTGCDADATR